MTLVSFVVPTLNRGGYVLRAVDSCLRAAERANVRADIIVLDSQSDDGSWEALQNRFGGNAAVRLAQNQRGLGPTRSWLDGADLVGGDFVTFIWSDDYIAPHFLTRLLPALHNGSVLAVGRGAIRDVDNNSPLNDTDKRIELSGANVLEGYLGTHPLMVDPPVSPASALFRRDAFERWKTAAPAACKATELRQQLMWRRAIGPDLLLHLVALRAAGDDCVVLSKSDVVQFSAHDDSITIGSPPWLLRAGYWLSRTTAVLDLGALEVVSRAVASRLCTRIILQGMALTRSIPSNQSGLEDTQHIATLVRDEVKRVRAKLIEEQGRLSLVTGAARVGLGEIRRLIPRPQSISWS